MIKTFKFRLFPTSAQKTKLNKSLSKCCEIYNKLLELKIKEYKENGKNISLYELQKELTKFKQNDNTLKNFVHSQVLQNITVRIDLAFQSFFQRLKRKETPGFPRFKSKFRYSSITFPQSGFKLMDNKFLKISKIGEIKIKISRDFPLNKIKILNINKDSLGNFYACFVCEVDKNELLHNKEVIGIDFGCKDIVTLSNGTKIENPKFYKKDLTELKKIQSKYSKDISKKNKRKLLHIHNRISNRRNDFIHKLSRKLINENQIICIEDLSIKQLVKDNFKTINRSIFDAAWYKLKSQLIYKAEEAGRVIVFVPSQYTTQECSNCGILKKKKLNERVHTCTCGLSIDRDLNAAINILRRGLSSLEFTPRSPQL